jgi:hypothetical protein
VPTNETLDERLARYHRETMRAVAPPGANAVRRTVLRRQRRRVVLAGVAAVLAVASAIGLSRFLPTHVAPINPEPSVSASTPAAPPASSPPASAASPSTSPSPTPSSSASSASAGPVSGTDLHVTGPTSVTLASDGTVYRGQFNLIITNTGDPYQGTVVYLTNPAGVDVDYAAGDPGFANCLNARPPETWFCSGPSIPAGGRVDTTVHIVAQYAPRTTELVIDGFALRYAGGTGPDPTPADNIVTLRIVLPAAG